MASSSENLIAMETWLLRSTFSDAWMMTEEGFTKDNEFLVRALQETFSDNNNNQSEHHAFDNQLYPNPTRFQTPTPTFSGGSETDTVVSKGKKGTNTTATAAATGGEGINGGKITKRKRRKSKRSTTTVIMADPANFRWMVQQVTGFRLEGNLQLPVFNPDPELRPDSNLMQQQNSSSCLLPTFDTSSALLLDPTNQQQHVEGQPAVSVSRQPETVHGGGFDFGSFCNFPTLDSWNV